ncbi:MAG: Ig-like domain-containing protein, partial [Verrucomicrobia bacterium]|nr:Ig-like domain-containing protein [Verrucomicrobiota bacterium]
MSTSAPPPIRPPGNYTVVVKNSGGTVTSSPPAILMLLPAITNLTPATDFAWPAGSNVTFTVGATGTAPLSYQWQFNDSPIPGAVSNKYTLHLGNAGQAGSYSVLVSNAACALAGVGPEESLGINLTVLPETNRPSITITNPANGARWSNAVITVRGTAADNGEVEAVRFQLNTATNVYTAAGTNVWVADFPGIPGTNTITAYSVDYYGNQSTNATRNIFYVVPSPFTLLKSGLGTITTNWTGPNLEIGRNYTMSAAASTGFKFTGWTGGVTATNASLTFMMQSNLVIQANFVDSQLPTIAITNPVSNSTFSNSPAVTVKGTASDNSQVAAVRWQLNSDAWAIASGTNSWQAAVTLLPGTNIFRAYSVDAGGNNSPTNSLNLIYWLIAPVTVETDGSGTISANYSGQTLILGKSYTMTATATSGSGYVFTNWTGGTNLPLAVLTNGAVLKFVMESNLMVQANFADTNKPVLTITNP